MSEYVVSDGNVFADLGLPRADIAMAKAEIMNRIRTLVDDHHVSAERVGQLLGLEPSRVSDLLTGRLGVFSIEQLICILNTAKEHLG